ncbi:hypothetical protein Ancab_030220 [Ancistrocladus abbreviatus]
MSLKEYLGVLWLFALLVLPAFSEAHDGMQVGHKWKQEKKGELSEVNMGGGGGHVADKMPASGKAPLSAPPSVNLQQLIIDNDGDDGEDEINPEQSRIPPTAGGGGGGEKHEEKVTVDSKVVGGHGMKSSNTKQHPIPSKREESYKVKGDGGKLEHKKKKRHSREGRQTGKGSPRSQKSHPTKRDL